MCKDPEEPFESVVKKPPFLKRGREVVRQLSLLLSFPSLTSPLPSTFLPLTSSLFSFFTSLPGASSDRSRGRPSIPDETQSLAGHRHRIRRETKREGEGKRRTYGNIQGRPCVTCHLRVSFVTRRHGRG